MMTFAPLARLQSRARRPLARLGLLALACTLPLAAQGPTPAAVTTQSGLPPAASSTAPQAPARIVTGVTIVDVPVLVIGPDGAPRANLPQQDFQVLDNGHPQRLAAFDNQPRPVSLAIVIDTSEPEAVAQAHRAAQVFADLLVGGAGEAGIFIAGPEPRLILPFTSDAALIVRTLKHLRLGARGNGITEPLSMAVLALQKRPRQRTRAVVVITRSDRDEGHFAQAVVETSMTDATPIFRLAPNMPKGASDINPISPEQAGPGPGSQREPVPVPPVGAHGNIGDSGPGSAANLNLGSLVGGVAASLRGHRVDYVLATGGLSLRARNDGDFDRKLNNIGDAIRGIYHLYYQPNNLTRQPQLHQIAVQVSGTASSHVAFRHEYLGYRR